ncbi:DUF2852 domain-containing protein [Tropicibacter naphthalenivorans]|uniref:DUF2852 domain-containing protein n=1 Tax=Tropicibacter naphthalenivorans TaxID=441103 RepID=A0A0P1G7L0_9RHOB|nr:DUF2852 domain-containing protein [Tropicibacter naphthalenivorans]CUH77570.1 hypothetical protein TRN7648_01545 [Tropicibacter naphthalenivorans]SMC56342.1 Protein of unknown function [Tropicibacter naphthalenivorans]
MTTAAYTTAMPANAGWLTRTEAWLDHKGKGAWIAAMVLGFIFFWPVGLALLAYMIWSKRMFGKSCRSHNPSARKQAWAAMKPSGNRAFDAYKAETLHRLETEQEAFEAFLERLREAKDKSEFDQFMEDRAKRVQTQETADA